MNNVNATPSFSLTGDIRFKGEKTFIRDNQTYQLVGEFFKKNYFLDSYLDGKAKTYIDGVLVEEGRYTLGFFKKGKKYFSDGTIHKGPFLNGVLQGKGKIYRKVLVNNKIKKIIEKEGFFINGQCS